MGRRKANGGGGLILLFGFFVLLAAIPKEIWIAIVVAIGIGFVYYVYKSVVTNKSGRVPEETLAEIVRADSPQTRDPPIHSPAALQNIPANAPAPSQWLPRTDFWAKGEPQIQPYREATGEPLSSKLDTQPSEFHAAALPAKTVRPTATESRRIPSQPAADAVKGQWIRSDQRVTLGGLPIAGGMLYIGHELQSPVGDVDPCLINLHKNVALEGDFAIRQMDYWPSYSRITPTARRAYLNWLADGRRSPNCDIGFVFLFFYGLERRVLFDSQGGIDVTRDLAAIADELRRLAGIYGQSSASFRSYAGGLLDWIERSSPSDRLYERPVPKFAPSYDVPFHLRLALGQACRDRVPVPAALALSWTRANPMVSLRTPATRCEAIFDQLFVEIYAKTHGAGMVLPKSRTKVKLLYEPASAGLRTLSPFSKTFGDTPDVTLLSAPAIALQEIADQCADDLAPYSRLIGRNPEAGESIEGLICLPTTLWPAQMRRRLALLVDGIDADLRMSSIDEVLTALDPRAAVTVSKEVVIGVAKSLYELGVGMEPNVLEGAKRPKSGDPVVLFKLSGSEGPTDTHDGYQLAVVTLQIASGVARADGNFDSSETAHLESEIQQWLHLTPVHRSRLRAHLRWLSASPVTLSSLTKKLEPLDVEARESIARFVVTLTQADGAIAPTEIAFLEKVYKALEVDSQRLPSDIHAIGIGVSASKSSPDAGFRLDSARIAALKRDTEKVSALLANIFVEAEETIPLEGDIKESDATGLPIDQLLGLDKPHTGFVRMLLSRPQWSRDELEDAAADLGLMLDGALEMINEAALDAHDDALIEGEDPMDVNQEIREALAA